MERGWSQRPTRHGAAAPPRGLSVSRDPHEPGHERANQEPDHGRCRVGGGKRQRPGPESDDDDAVEQASVHNGHAGRHDARPEQGHQEGNDIAPVLLPNQDRSSCWSSGDCLPTGLRDFREAYRIASRQEGRLLALAVRAIPARRPIEYLEGYLSMTEGWCCLPSHSNSASGLLRRLSPCDGR